MRTYTKRIVTHDKVSGFLHFLEGFKEKLGCCERFLTLEDPNKNPCTKCTSSGLKPGTKKTGQYPYTLLYFSKSKQVVIVYMLLNCFVFCK